MEVRQQRMISVALMKNVSVAYGDGEYK